MSGLHPLFPSQGFMTCPLNLGLSHGMPWGSLCALPCFNPSQAARP